VTAARRWIVVCVLAGFALRVGFALVYWVDQPLTHDEREYLALGRSLARGDGFRYPADEPPPGTGQQFGRAPGYPLFLATLRVTEPADRVPRRVQIAQSALGALGIWLMAAIAGRAAGPRAAVTAAAIAAVYPPLVWMPSYALSETLFSTLCLTIAWSLQSASTTPTRSSIAAAALLTGLAILVRPAMVFFLPFAAVWMIARRRPADALVFVLLALLCVLPWTIRNHRVYGRWIAVASEGGVTFWTGNHPLALGEGDLAANPPLKRAELAFRAEHPDLTPEQLEPLYYRDALAWIRREPAAWLVLLSRKLFYTIVPIGPSYALHSLKYFAASAVSYLLVLPAAAVGAWRWRAASQGERAADGRGVSPAALWLMAAATVAAGLVFFPQERFRIPVIDPALIVTAALLAGSYRDESTGRYADI
jgi:Dolichyl-phosphate-mannose-protein mannosyltransferase